MRNGRNVMRCDTVLSPHLSVQMQCFHVLSVPLGMRSKGDVQLYTV